MVAQLGRFDLVSLLLAVIGILIALAGVIAFINFRSVARRQAKEEAQRIAAETAERTANEYLQAELPKLLEEYRELFGSNCSSEEIDKIAKAQEWSEIK